MAGKTGTAAGRKKTAAKKTGAKSKAPRKQSGAQPAGSKQTGAKGSSSKKKAGKAGEKAKPASQKTGTKKGARQKTDSAKATTKTAAGKKTGAPKTGAARSAKSKSACPGRSRPASRKPLSKTSRTNGRPGKGRSSKTSNLGGLNRFFNMLPTLLLVGGLALGLYIWLQATDPAVLSPDYFAEEKHPPRKIRQFEKGSAERGAGAAVPPSAEAGVPGSTESGLKPKTAAGDPASGPKPAQSSDDRPLAAIIIDDIGADKVMAEQFFELEVPLTYSILPHTRYQREIAEEAARRGYQVMLHLPMEPNEYPLVDPGPGALLTGMTPDERIAQLKIDLAAVPHIQGVNNHMGSKMTAMADQMRQVFTILKKRDLFFIDSRTTAATQCRSAARLFDLAFAERDVFLDHVQSRKAIGRQIEEFINVAEINGTAIAIGHPHPETYSMIAEKLPEIRRRLRLVPASELARVF